MTGNQPFQFLFVAPEDAASAGQPGFDATAMAARIAGPARPTGRRDKILVISGTDGRDANAEAVVAELMVRGVRPFYLHTSELLSTCHFAFQIGGDDVGLKGRLALPTGELALDEVSAVWCASPWFAPILAEGTGGEEADFAQREVEGALHGLFGLLRDAFWMNPPNAVFAAEDKLAQLEQARGLGMRIPRTLVTNDATRAREFFEECAGEMIVKSFRRHNSRPPLFRRPLFTSRVTREHLTEIERVRFAPCLFQEYVPKEFEVRVTVVGWRVFAAEIHSQESELDRDDYRHYDFANTRYMPHTLAPAVEAACVGLAERYSLALSAIDMIRRPDGEYVFLEINTNPAFLWIQDLTGLPIRQAIAELLLQSMA